MSFSILKITRIALPLFLLLISLAGGVLAQSTDVVRPTPVRTNEAKGTITALDLGDPRLTDHYFAFTAVPGDLLVTVQTSNLNGDVDIFTSNGLRPLLKFTVYADVASPTTKSVYFRKREDLILRIEARTPNDEPGTYRVHFGGAFEPITSGPLLAENAETPVEVPAETTAKKGRRVSSVGARIEEPTPPETVAETPKEAPAETAAATPPTPRRGRRGSTPRRRASQPAERDRDSRSTTETTARAEPSEKPAETQTESETETRPTASSRRAANRRTSSARRVRPVPPPPPPQEPEPETGPRLVIEVSDGTSIDRSMSTVRRVTIENGQVVVVGKDGKVNRVKLADVTRMTITPTP